LTVNSLPGDSTEEPPARRTPPSRAPAGLAPEQDPFAVDAEQIEQLPGRPLGQQAAVTRMLMCIVIGAGVAGLALYLAWIT
jgi:hypothetical protein